MPTHETEGAGRGLSEELVAKAAEALHRVECGCEGGCVSYEGNARAVIAAVAPAIEARALREAAERAEGWIAMESSSHLPERDRIGCTCGFGVWSAEHVAVMAFRDGFPAFIAHDRADRIEGA